MSISVYVHSVSFLQKQGKAFKIPFSITRICFHMTTKQSRFCHFFDNQSLGQKKNETSSKIRHQ